MDTNTKTGTETGTVTGPAEGQDGEIQPSGGATDESTRHAHLYNARDLTDG